jgi:hypothetical protein
VPQPTTEELPLSLYTGFCSGLTYSLYGAYLVTLERYSEAVGAFRCAVSYHCTTAKENANMMTVMDLINRVRAGTGVGSGSLVDTLALDKLRTR